ncbi:MAG: coniferyl-alcohol dehydrogenase [Sphingobium sp.]
MQSDWSFEGKRVVVTGCFSGMGEAVAREILRLGGEVHGIDIKPSAVPLASFTQVDLRDPASIDAAVASIGGEIDNLYNCAGLPQTFPALDVMKVNFLGLRHLTESWLPRIRKGGAIVNISSLAGMGYMQQLPVLKEFLAIEGFAAGLEWAEQNPDKITDGYGFSKAALNAYTNIKAIPFIGQGVRINSTMPSTTATPMLPDFVKVAGQEVLDFFAQATGGFATAEDQALPVVFLGTGAARFINGVNIAVDGGFAGGVMTGVIDMSKVPARH